MKTLSGRFRFVVFGVIVIVAVVSCCNFPFIPDIASYSVEIGGKQKASTYVEWKDERQFENALKQVRGHEDKGASYCLCVMRTPHATHRRIPYSKCPRGYECPPGNIRTVKVTKSKAADNIAAGESAVNDPHVTYRVQSPYPGDITQVLDALKQ
ncbi:MAG: hypothetical protein DME99_04010 [Verrucomicrobia bacterium]|nr:MAG: hypothetical protein DME99_04010 [Verrucomicrobiota bacterium]